MLDQFDADRSDCPARRPSSGAASEPCSRLRRRRPRSSSAAPWRRLPGFLAGAGEHREPLAVRTWCTQDTLRPAAAITHGILYLFIGSENLLPVVHQDGHCNQAGYVAYTATGTIYIDLQLLQLFEFQLIARLGAARLRSRPPATPAPSAPSSRPKSAAEPSLSGSCAPSSCGPDTPRRWRTSFQSYERIRTGRSRAPRRGRAGYVSADPSAVSRWYRPHRPPRPESYRGRGSTP